MIRLIYIATPLEVPTSLQQYQAAGRNNQQWLLDALMGGIVRLGAMPVRPSVVWKDGRTELLARMDAVITYGDWFHSDDARAEVMTATTIGKPVFESLDALRMWLHGLDGGGDDDGHRNGISQPLPESGRPGTAAGHRHD